MFKRAIIYRISASLFVIFLFWMLSTSDRAKKIYGFIFPANYYVHFQYTDFSRYFKNDSANNDDAKSSDILLINTDNLFLCETMEVVKKALNLNPRVVGLQDVFKIDSTLHLRYDNKFDTVCLGELVRLVESTPRIVVGGTISNNSESGSIPASTEKSGISDFSVHAASGRTRTHLANIKIGVKYFPSFASLIHMTNESNLVVEAAARDSSIIRYSGFGRYDSSGYFMILNAKDFLQNQRLQIENRIVLIGNTTLKKNVTTINEIPVGWASPDMSDLEVTANVLEMKMTTGEPYEISKGATLLITILIMVFHLWLLAVIDDKIPLYFDMFTVMLIFLFSAFLALTELWLFVMFNVKIDFSDAVTLTTLVSVGSLGSSMVNTIRSKLRSMRQSNRDF